MNALIGCTGFVGSTLLRQTRFDCLYRSNDIERIRGCTFDTIVCAGAPAQKWIANREPDADRKGIIGLMDHLETVQCETFVLISTVDVFTHPVTVDEDSPVSETGLHPYGTHRRLLEKFVEHQFGRRLIVRLPGLVGPGLRKNAIFDLHNHNELQAIDSRGVFQFYPMVNLHHDIQTALAAQLSLIHLTAAPISISDLARLAFGRAFAQTLAGQPATYDMRSRHAALFGGQGHYQYSARDTIQAARWFAQSEPPAAASRDGMKA